MSIQTELTRITNAKAAIKTAIEGKGVTVPDGTMLDGMAALISSIQVGGGNTGGSTSAVPPKDVNFYDYDGTRLYSYTVAEARALTELPELPTQPGLTCQGWNWTLTDIKAMNRAVDVGAMYITDDGKTRLYITIAADGRMTVPLHISQTVAEGVVIDWGDGSQTEAMSVTGKNSITHTYANIGHYTITLGVADGCTLGLGHDSSAYVVIGGSSNVDKAYNNMLKKVEIGKGVERVGTCAFQHCYSLESITIPNSVTRIDGFAFQYCYSLASIIIPNSATLIDTYAFRECRSLESIIIPNSITTIGTYAFCECRSLESIIIPNSIKTLSVRLFESCYSLASIIIPNSITIISTYAFRECLSLASIIIPNSIKTVNQNVFYNCYGVGIYDFTSHTSVPKLSNINAFTGIPSDCQIRVPAALYDEWIAASNWSTYASQIVAV